MDRIALQLLSGLGANGVLLGILALAGASAAAPVLLLLEAAYGLFCAIRIGRSRRPADSRAQESNRARSFLVATSLAVIAVSSAGWLPPATEFDTLAYHSPIVRHLALGARWEFWPDQWRSVFPLSQALLGSAVLRLGGSRPAIVNGFELVLAALLLSAVARRCLLDRTAAAIAPILAFGCVVVPAAAAGLQEDLLLVAATLAVGHGLLTADEPARVRRTGVFAGIAAGAKLSGLPIAAAAILWTFLSSPGKRLRSSLAVSALAAAAGGIWYGVNVARFGNPIPPFAAFLGRPFLSPGALSQWASELSSFGRGRGAGELLLAPFEIFISPGDYSGRGNLFNPLALLGVASAATKEGRRRFGPLLFLSASIYAAFFAVEEVSRLLLPAAVLLSVPAAFFVARLGRRGRVAGAAAGAFLAASAGVAILVAGLPIGRWIADPSAYLEKQSQNFADVDWMNRNLDPLRHRVATEFVASGCLTIPWLALSPLYQAEIAPEALTSEESFFSALRARGVTHLFLAEPAHLPFSLEGSPRLRKLRSNPASRLGGTRLLREPPTQATSIYEIVD